MNPKKKNALSVPKFVMAPLPFVLRINDYTRLKSKSTHIPMIPVSIDVMHFTVMRSVYLVLTMRMIPKQVRSISG